MVAVDLEPDRRDQHSYSVLALAYPCLLHIRKSSCIAKTIRMHQTSVRLADNMMTFSRSTVVSLPQLNYAITQSPLFLVHGLELLIEPRTRLIQGALRLSLAGEKVALYSSRREHALG